MWLQLHFWKFISGAPVPSISTLDQFWFFGVTQPVETSARLGHVVPFCKFGKTSHCGVSSELFLN